jgi:O-antigen/teichoic acid export membrane protein
MSWLVAAKVLRLGFVLLITVYIARYLGPAGYGVLSYVTAFVALFASVASLGLNSIVVRDLVQNCEAAPATLGTATILQMVGGLLAGLLAVVSITYYSEDSDQVTVMVAILGFSLVFKASDVIRYWFESIVESKYTVWAEMASFALILVVKVLLVLYQAPLIYFVWAVALESLLLAIGMVLIYQYSGGKIGAWRMRFELAGSLLKNSWPLILSSLAIMVYLRIDQVMIRQMLGDEATGKYSAAISISEAWYFIPMIIASTVFPAIIEARTESLDLYYLRLQQLFRLMVWLAVIVAVPISFLSEWLVVFLFGNAYAGAGEVLSVHIWAGVFVFLGVASGKWLLLENLQKHALYRTALGAVVNIVANLVLIPEYGILGAAVATLLSQAFVAYLYDFFSPSTRRIVALKTRSLLLVLK